MVTAIQMKLVNDFNIGGKEYTKKKCTLENHSHNETSKMQQKFKCYKQKTITKPYFMKFSPHSQCNIFLKIYLH